MATHQQYKLRFLLTIFKLLHAFLFTSCIISTHARQTNVSHYPKVCKMDNVSPNTMILTRYYVPSIANPIADITQPYSEDPNGHCLPHRINERQPQLRKILQPSLSLQSHQDVAQQAGVKQPHRNPPNGNWSRLQPHRNDAQNPTAAQSRGEALNRGYLCLQPPLQHGPITNRSDRKIRADSRLAEPHQVSPLKLKTLVALIYDVCSKNRGVTSKAKMYAAQTTIKEGWSSNQSYLQASRTPSFASSHREGKQKTQAANPGGSRNPQPIPNTTDALSSRKNRPTCHTKKENREGNKVRGSLGTTSTFLTHRHTYGTHQSGCTWQTIKPSK